MGRVQVAVTALPLTTWHPATPLTRLRCGGAISTARRYRRRLAPRSGRPSAYHHGVCAARIRIHRSVLDIYIHRKAILKTTRVAPQSNAYSPPNSFGSLPRCPTPMNPTQLPISSLVAPVSRRRYTLVSPVQGLPSFSPRPRHPRLMHIRCHGSTK